MTPLDPSRQGWRCRAGADDRSVAAQANRIMEEAGYLDEMEVPRSDRLTRLLLIDSPLSPQERLEDDLGEDLARFLVTALADGQGRPGSSSP